MLTDLAACPFVLDLVRSGTTHLNDSTGHPDGELVSRPTLVFDIYPDVIFHTITDPIDITQYYARVFEALSTMHAKNIIHRDLKPSNILTSRIDGMIDIQVCDFEAATKDTTAPYMGTTGYQAPELLDGQSCSFASDIFAVGVTMHMMLTRLRDSPFYDTRTRKTNFRSMYGRKGLWTKMADIGLTGICRACLSKNPSDRPTASHVRTSLASLCMLAVSQYQLSAHVTTDQVERLENVIKGKRGRLPTAFASRCIVCGVSGVDTASVSCRGCMKGLHNSVRTKKPKRIDVHPGFLQHLNEVPNQRAQVVTVTQQRSVPPTQVIQDTTPPQATSDKPRRSLEEIARAYR